MNVSATSTRHNRGMLDRGGNKAAREYVPGGFGFSFHDIKNSIGPHPNHHGRRCKCQSRY